MISMGMTGRVGLIVLVLSLAGWFVYVPVVVLPTFQSGDGSSFNIGQMFFVTFFCEISATLGWILAKEG